MITHEEYSATKKFIEKVSMNLFEHEKGQRESAKVGFPYINYCDYYIEGRRFFCVKTNVFKALIDSHIVKAQKKYPQLFGTGNAKNVIKAIYNVEKTLQLNWFSDFLRKEQFAYIFEYKNQNDFDKVLRIDLFRRLDKNCLNKYDFTGGIMHAFKHFSIDGINLSTGKDINNLQNPEELLIKATKAFFINKLEAKGEKKFDTYDKIDEKYSLKFSFFFEPKTNNIYHLNTVFKTKPKY